MFQPEWVDKIDDKKKLYFALPKLKSCSVHRKFSLRDRIETSVPWGPLDGDVRVVGPAHGHPGCLDEMWTRMDEACYEHQPQRNNRYLVSHTLQGLECARECVAIQN